MTTPATRPWLRVLMVLWAVTLPACDFEVDIDEFILKTTPMSESADAEVRAAKEAAEQVAYKAEANRLWKQVLVGGDKPLPGGELRADGTPKTLLDRAIELDPMNEQFRALRFVDQKVAARNSRRGATGKAQLVEAAAAEEGGLLRAVARKRARDRAAQVPPVDNPKTSDERAAEDHEIAQRASLMVLQALAKRLVGDDVGTVERRSSGHSDWPQFLEYCDALARHAEDYPSDPDLDHHKFAYGDVKCPSAAGPA